MMEGRASRLALKDAVLPPRAQKEACPSSDSLRPADQSEWLCSLSCSHEDFCVFAAVYRGCVWSGGGLTSHTGFLHVSQPAKLPVTFKMLANWPRSALLDAALNGRKCITFRIICLSTLSKLSLCLCFYSVFLFVQPNPTSQGWVKSKCSFEIISYFSYYLREYNP